jgi:uncharacterized membrane protein YdjX (TVP38/TMEM64 family)
MKQFWQLSGVILFTLLLVFIIFSVLEIPMLQDPFRWMTAPSAGVALFSLGLLFLDVVLPIPASLVMIANGAVFGFPLGMLLSLVGGIGATITGFAIGKQGSKRVLTKIVPPEQRLAANQMFKEWGMVAIVVTRPIPLLSETTSIMAGTSQMPLRQIIVSSIAGYLPTAALYAFTGSLAVNFDSSLWAFALVMLAAGFFWILRRPLNKMLSKS